MAWSGRSTTSACTVSLGSPTVAAPPAGWRARTIRGPTTWRATWSAFPARRAFPEHRSDTAKLTELPAAECAGFLWISLDRNATLDIPAFLGPLADELDSWGIGRWSPLGEKVLDCPDQLETRHRHVRGELSLRHGAQDDVRHHRPQQLHGVRLLRSASPTRVPAQRDSRSREHSRGAMGPTTDHGGHLRAVSEYRAFLHHRQRRTVSCLSRRCARPLDHGPSELHPAGHLRRVGGRGCCSGVRLRAFHRAR